MEPAAGRAGAPSVVSRAKFGRYDVSMDVSYRKVSRTMHIYRPDKVLDCRFPVHDP